MNRRNVRLFGFALALGSVLIGTCAAQQMPRTSEERFARLDSDRSGTVDQDEYETSVRQIFSDLDSDKNNRVSNAELTAASAPQGEGMPSPADRIRFMDMNTDGELTEEELERGAERAFQRFDTNTDGSLDLAELKSGGY
jgi:Ca2+-binding EF-hand superfamily protein